MKNMWKGAFFNKIFFKNCFTLQTNYNDCLLGNNTCYHGGTCRDLVGGFMCDCLPGWTDPRCETQVQHDIPYCLELCPGAMTNFGGGTTIKIVKKLLLV